MSEDFFRSISRVSVSIIGKSIQSSPQSKAKSVDRNGFSLSISESDFISLFLPMKKTLPLALILVVTLSGCTFPWQKTTTPETETVIEDTETGSVTGTTTAPIVPEPPKDITPSDTPKAIAAGGVYLPYTPTAVAQAKGQVVLFFHANWCPTCIAVNKDIDANLKNIPADLTLLKTSYDDEKELKELY